MCHLSLNLWYGWQERRGLHVDPQMPDAGPLERDLDPAL
jgi:hypothetical protein